MSKESAWELYKKQFSGSKPWHFLDPSSKLTGDETYEKRINICKECPRLIQSTKQCKECGCFMTAKARLDHSSCPLGKW